MAGDQTNWYIQAFRENVYVLGQQKQSRLRSAVFQDNTKKGEGAFFDRLGATAMVKKTSRYQPTPVIEQDHSRRYLTWDEYLWSVPVESDDALKMLADPVSQYSQNAIRAYGRQIDDILIAAINGTAKTGKNGTGTQALPSGQKVLQAFETRKCFTVTKWIEAKRILDHGEIDDGDRYIAVRALDISLALQPDAISSTLPNPLLSIDYATAKGLVEGTITRYLGMDVIRTERLLSGTANGAEASTTAVLVWQKMGVGLSIPEDAETNLAKDPSINYNWRPHLKAGIGAVRIEDEAVVQLNCKDTAS